MRRDAKLNDSKEIIIVPGVTHVDLYDQMIRWYRTFLDTPNGRECIEEFDRILPEYTWMSSVKKIDFYLWSIRE